MYVVIVNIQVKSDRIEEFKTASMFNAQGTRKEPGNVRFDIVQGVDDPMRFHLIEVYKTPEDFKSHQMQPHYLTWKKAVESWMAQPRSSTKNRALFFGDGVVP